MSFVDAQTLLYDAAALTATGVSDNCYDCGAVPSGGTSYGDALDFSVGEPMGVVVAVGVAAKVSGGTETYEFDIISSTATNLTSSQTIIAQFPFTYTQAGTLLTAGSQIVLPFPPGSILQRYVGIKFIGANTPTITVTAWITPLNMVQKQKLYTSLIVVQ